MKAAIEALKQEQPGKLIVAVPVAPSDTAAVLQKIADMFVCLETVDDFLRGQLLC